MMVLMTVLVVGKENDCNVKKDMEVVAKMAQLCVEQMQDHMS